MNRPTRDGRTNASKHRRVIHARTAIIGFVATAVGVSLGAAAPAIGAEWPQFRGPGRDGISLETGLLDVWPERGPDVVWRKRLGEGYSGLSVAGGRIFTMFASDADEFAVSIDAATGKEIWRVRTDATFRDSHGNGPRSTPTVADGLVYALSARGKLYALRAEDGTAVWSRDLPKEFGADPPRWGVSTSPLVEGELLLLDAGGDGGRSILALDRRTGEEVWASQSDKPGYSAPVAVTIGGLRQVLFLTATRLVALAPATGELLWKVSWETSYDVNASTPVFVPPDKVFVSTGYDVGAAMFRVTVSEGKATVEQLWKSRQMRNKFSSSIHLDGQIYGFDEKNLKCIDAATGELRWQVRGLGHGSLFYADGHLVVLSEDGTLVLADAAPEKYVERGRVQVFDGRTWTVPTLAEGRLFLRDTKELVALDLAE